MAKIKKLAVLLFSVLMAFGISAMAAGCSDSDRLDELQKRLEALEKETNDRLAEMEKKLAEQSVGTFYSLQEAYEMGLLTKTDLKDCCYFRFGEVWEGEEYNPEEWTKVEYTPTKSLSNLDKAIEIKIKETYYKLNEDRFYSKNEGFIGGIDDLTVRFFGEFNNSYVILIDCSLWNYGASVTPMLVAGIGWWESDEGFKVFRTE